MRLVLRRGLGGGEMRGVGRGDKVGVGVLADWCSNP